MSRGWKELLSVWGLAWLGLAAADLAEEAQRAKRAMLAQRYSEAADIYRRMVAELPGEPGVRFNLALALHSMGRYHESTQTLEALRAGQENNPKFWFLLGEGYLNLEEPQKAVDPLLRAAVLEPTNLDTSLELASALLESKQFDKAAERFQLLAAEHPELPRVWAGLSLSRTGQPAQEATQRLAALPESAEQHEMLARIYSHSGQRTEAIAELRAGLKLAPGDVRLKGALARALLANREFDEAVQVLGELLAGNPENPSWQFEMGDALLGTAQVEQAITHLRRAILLAPVLLPAQAKLGEALVASGAPGEAVAHLELAAPTDPDGSIHFQLAKAYRKLGKADLANKAMARRLEILKSIETAGH